MTTLIQCPSRPNVWIVRPRDPIQADQLRNCIFQLCSIDTEQVFEGSTEKIIALDSMLDIEMDILESTLLEYMHRSETNDL